MSKSITLKELLECEFTINENGKMVGEIPLERINEIADILTNQQQRIDKAIEYINQKWKKDGYYTSVENCLQFCKWNEFEKEELLEILGDKDGTSNIKSS